MIGWIQGELVEKEESHCLVAAGGVGYSIQLTAKDSFLLPHTGERVTLHLSPVFREDSQQLYGFLDKGAKIAFSELNKANGVGPKMALQILETYTIEELSLYIAQNNHLALTRVKGVGPKVAKRLVLELKGKLIYRSHPDRAMQSSSAQQEAIKALVNLGYKDKQASDMVSNASGISVEEIIKSALQKEGAKV